MLKIRYHKQFKKDFKLAMKRGLKAELLEEVLKIWSKKNNFLLDIVIIN